MKYYELSDYIMDETFLQGKAVLCKVTLRPEETLLDEELIVVKLSNGSKYKGKISQFKPIQIGKYQVGEAVIIRVSSD